jgi:hypothetical protein
MSSESAVAVGEGLTEGIGRLFRLLAAFNVVEERAEDKFKPIPFSYAIGDDSTKVRASLQAA